MARKCTLYGEEVQQVIEYYLGTYTAARPVCPEPFSKMSAIWTAPASDVMLEIDGRCRRGVPALKKVTEGGMQWRWQSPGKGLSLC